MKHFYISIFVFFLTLNLNAQSVTISGPNEIEVGVPSNFTFSVDGLSVDAEDYEINYWQVSPTYHLGSGEIQGHINNEELPTYESTNTPKDLTIPIQWGSDVPVDIVEIRAYASGYYLDENDYPYEPFSTGALNHSTKEVEVLRICTPNIVYDEVEDCSEDLVEIRAENYCHGDQFNWALSEGTIEDGQGTSSILVSPPLSGNFSASVAVTRSTANPNYVKEETQVIERTDPEAILELIGDENPSYICKGIGLEFGIQNQDNILDVEWNASNANISSESIVDGKRVVTIAPNSSRSNGSTLYVNATVNYEGGCASTTLSKSFTVYEPETPPSPQGYVYMSPLPEGASVCEAQGFEVVFVASNPYSNGRTSVSQAVIPPHAANNPYPIHVSYRNLCTGQQSSTTFYTSPPVPCEGGPGPIKPFSSAIAIAPNPTNGNFSVNFEQKVSGSYTIYNANGAAVQHGEIKEKDILHISFNEKLKGGNYFIEISTKENTVTKQIILKR